MTNPINNNFRVGNPAPIPLKKSPDVEGEKKKLYNSAREMESLFLYHMLKEMRKTVPQNEGSNALGLGNGLGKDIYTQVFDEELSRKIAGNGDKSLTNLLYHALEKAFDRQHGEAESKAIVSAKLLPEAKYISISRQEEKFIDLNGRVTPRKGKQPVAGNAVEVNTPSARKGGARMITNDPDQIDLVGRNKSIDAKVESKAINASPEQKTDSSDYKEIIKEASEKFNLDPTLLESIIEAESAGNPQAVSSAGAKGLMQLADTTAADMGVRNVFDPQENIHAGAKFLRRLIDRFGDIKKALAAYNAGPETVERYRGIPPYPETRRYVQKVLQGVTGKTKNYE